MMASSTISLSSSSSSPSVRTLVLSKLPARLTTPTAAGLSGLAVLFGLCGAAYHRAGTIFMMLVSALAFLVTLVVWVVEMVLFGVARDRMRDRGLAASWGNANWLVLGALVALFLAFFASLCGSFGRYGRRRNY